MMGEIILFFEWFWISGHNSPYPGQHITAGLSTASVAIGRDKVRKSTEGQRYRRLAAGVVSTTRGIAAALISYGAFCSGSFTVPMSDPLPQLS
ncbi:hypothetical protein NST41_33105 [Paenibacillus sp. FSL L8-0696]|uniref:hypothetical protein n=1 Tax=Paenibacillus TaxID=44249 RepID=UPI00117BF882|nr:MULTISPECIES: hypothetical protein [Paenibacillus]